MGRWNRLISTGAVLVLAVGLAACTSEADPVPVSTAPVVQLGAPGEPNRTMSPEEAAEDIEISQAAFEHRPPLLDGRNSPSKTSIMQ